jgi:hypothetical protein
MCLKQINQFAFPFPEVSRMIEGTDLKTAGLPRVMAGLMILSCLAGCSTVSVDNAKTLGAAGKEVSTQVSSNIFASDDEYRQGIEADLFLHGYADTQVPEAVAAGYRKVAIELGARKLVFSKLHDLYSAFYDLASSGDGSGIDRSLVDFGNAVNGYAASRQRRALVPSSAVGLAGEAGKLIAADRQRRSIIRTSALIRGHLIELLQLLDDPLVRTQMETFRQNLVQNRVSAIKLLWRSGLLDPVDLIDQMGQSEGLKTAPKSGDAIGNRRYASVRNGLQSVVDYRLENKVRLVAQGYDASVNALKVLIARHEKLEKGEEVSVAELRGISGELQVITGLLAKHASTNK